MTRKILVTICTLVLLFSTIAITNVQADTVYDSYQVGFARVDINPYVIDGDFSSGLMALPLRGTGDGWNRLSEPELYDDNGDGKIDSNDGLSATCVAISDVNGNTILMISIDLLGGDKAEQVQTEICARVEAALAKGELSNVTLTPEQIYYSGTHTHNAPDISYYKASGVTGYNKEGVDLSVVNANLGLWFERTVRDLGDAAIAALKDRAAAKITKHSISASSPALKDPVRGKVMNSVRHYYNEEDNCYGGDNFNTRGDDPKTVTEVDDTLYMLQFDFSAHNEKTGDNKLPIVLANWRGHPSLNNSNDYATGGKRALSSDYINSFCHALEYNCTVYNTGKGAYAKKQVYRAVFFQGAGGNVNPRGREIVKGVVVSKWIDDMGKTNGECRGNGYGRILCAMAKQGLKLADTTEEVAVGEISTLQYTYYTQRRTYGITALSYEAATAFQAEYAKNPNVSLPFRYTNTNGETYVIASRFHASNIVAVWNTTYQKPTDTAVNLTLNAVLIGKDLAFVTVPGEPFDYYYAADGSNAWDNLINEATYGKPLIFSLCNGSKGYVPNSKAYTYCEGSTVWATGSYETHTTPYPEGTGEIMVELFGRMLKSLESGTAHGYDGSCEHCDGIVHWIPYTGQGALDTGHYYLVSDVFTAQIHINAEQKVCFDLNGYTLRGQNRAFYTKPKGNSTLSIMDMSETGNGRVLGVGALVGVASGYGGGTIVVDSTDTLNLYSGTIGTYDRYLYNLGSGGTIYVIGTFNMYGGTVAAGVGSSFEGSYLKDGVPKETTKTTKGATIYISGTMNMYGGIVEKGRFEKVVGTVTKNAIDGYRYTQTVTPGEGVGSCIYLAGKLNLSGDAKIDDVHLGTTTAKLRVLKTDEAFSGKVNLTLGYALPYNLRVGNCDADTVIRGDAFTFTNGDIGVYADGGYLYADAAAALVEPEGDTWYYRSVTDAIAACMQTDETSYVKLTADVDKPIVLTDNCSIDLNGHHISGDITVKNGATLYCMDSQTDDYKVKDGRYGKLSGKMTGSISAMPENKLSATEGSSGYRAGYMMLQENDGISFYRLCLQVATVSYRPSVCGIYYTANIAGDELVKAQIKECGIVVNAYRAPEEESSVESGSNICVKFDPTKIGEGGIHSALISGIMKDTNTLKTNETNSEMPVYCNAYILTAEGQYYSTTSIMSLRNVVEAADEQDRISGFGLEQTMLMYEKYEAIMKKWNLPRLMIQRNKQGN